MQRRQHLVANTDDLVKEQVVEDAVATANNNVALVHRYAVHSAAALYDLDGNALVKVRVHAVVQTGHLQWALRVPVNALHLGVEHDLEVALAAMQLAEDEQLAVPDGEHGNHRVQLAVDPGAVVQDREADRGRAVALGRLEGVPHQGDGPAVGVQGPRAIRHQLRHGELLAGCQQLDRQLRGVHAELLDLRDAVGHAQQHGGQHRRVSVAVALGCLQRVRLLVSAGIEGERLVLLVLFREVLFSPLELIQDAPLLLRAH
mmetsp:Transcript_64692/g.89518  ORF Transcript_64692/g.89518 Transcript_64692/m.89518 type:complete len:259 (+) Transcript_64692:655-1431(+)